MLNGKSVLITGGTGSFGKKFVETILNRYPQVKRIVIYSRDELKQFELKQKYPEVKYPQLRFFIGDVRDGERLKRACEGIDVISMQQLSSKWIRPNTIRRNASKPMYMVPKM